MSDLDPQEEKKGEKRTAATIAGWVLLVLALVALAVFVGPCDPQPEPVPAGPQATTTGLPEAAPGESTSSSSSGPASSTSTTGETTSSGATGR